jgi:hypothetical protein
MSKNLAYNTHVLMHNNKKHHADEIYSDSDCETEIDQSGSQTDRLGHVCKEKDI